MAGYVFMKTSKVNKMDKISYTKEKKIHNHFFIINFSEIIPSLPGFVVNSSHNSNQPFLYCSGFSSLLLRHNTYLKTLSYETVASFSYNN